MFLFGIFYIIIHLHIVFPTSVCKTFEMQYLIWFIVSKIINMAFNTHDFKAVSQLLLNQQRKLFPDHHVSFVWNCIY